jgi:hypothetical protein
MVLSSLMTLENSYQIEPALRSAMKHLQTGTSDLQAKTIVVPDLQERVPKEPGRGGLEELMFEYGQ